MRLHADFRNIAFNSDTNKSCWQMYYIDIRLHKNGALVRWVNSWYVFKLETPPPWHFKHKQRTVRCDKWTDKRVLPFKHCGHIPSQHHFIRKE